MCEILINDLVEELSEENSRLFNELLVLNECFHVLIECKLYLNKILNLKTILKDLNHLSLEEIQTLEELYQKFNAIINDTHQHRISHEWQESEDNPEGDPEETPEQPPEVNDTVDQVIPSSMIIVKTENTSNDFEYITEGHHQMVDTDMTADIKSEPIYETIDGETIAGGLSLQTLKTRNNFTGKDFECDFIGCEEVFNTSGQLRKHRFIHRDDKPFKCYAAGCDYTYSTVPQMESHVNRDHKGVKPYVCAHEGCGKAFYNASAFNFHTKIGHYRSNTKWAKKLRRKRAGLSCKQYECHYIGCWEVFDRCADLKIHRVSHSGDKPHKCSVDGCDYLYSTEPQLEAHMNKHNGVQPYRCPHEWCGKGFWSENSLKFHISMKCRPRVAAKTPTDLNCDTNHALNETNREPMNDWIVSTIGESIDNLENERRLQEGFSEGVDEIIVPNNDLMATNDLVIKPAVKPFKCALEGCGQRFKSELRLRAHLQRHSTGKVMRCAAHECGQTFRDKRSLVRHMEMDHKIVDLFECTYVSCDRVFTTDDELTAHVNSKHLMVFKCESIGCGLEFANESSFRSHFRTSHPNGTLYQCDYSGCDYKNKNRARLQRHKRSHIDLRPHVCDTCGKGFKSRSALSRHMQNIHTTDRPFVCDTDGCDKGFATSERLVQHKYQCHRVGDGPVKCAAPGCGLEFINPYLLRRHMIVQHVDLSLRCEWPGCEYVAKNSTAYNNHKWTHSKERQFACEWPGCEYASKGPEGLRQHRLTHTGDNVCQWPECGKRFQSTRYLREHLAIHTGASHECHKDGCGKRFQSKYYLYKHINSAHKKPKKPSVFRCSQGCGQRFRSRYLVNKHINDCHSSGSHE